MAEGLSHKLKMIQIVKNTRKLFSKSIGVLFVYTILYSIFSNLVFFPISRKLWSLSLLTVKEGYISDQNIISVFTHPLVLLAGLFIVAGYCIICILETTGIMMILEYAYRNQPVKLLSIVPMSYRQVKHCLHPKNWMIFVYLLIIQPLVDSNFAGEMLSDITIPEFIMDYISARKLLYILLVIVVIAFLIFFIRYLFLPITMFLEKKSFVEASKKSVSFLKGRFISTYIKILLIATVASFVFSIVPLIVLYILQYALVDGFSNYIFAQDISKFLFDNLFVQVIDALKTVIVKIFTSAMVLTIYHELESQISSESDVDLPEECIKTEGKIYTFKRYVYALYLLVFVSAALLFVLFTKVSEIEPQIIAELINPTKIAAHKGYSSKAPENTLPAFDIAANCDVVDYIELDVRETKDGVPVVIHDASILAATGENILIYDIDYDELQKYNALYGHSEEEFANTRISSLDEVLNEYADKKNFIIEIKANKKTPELPKKIVELMEKYNITETSVIHSGNYDSLKAVKEINPNIKCGFIIAVSTGGYEDLPYADFFSVEHTYLSSNVISQIHKRGKEIYVWTVNEESSFNQVRDMNVDVLITDYPKEAYDGMHRYDNDLMDKLSGTFAVSNMEDTINENQIEYNGTGD